MFIFVRKASGKKLAQESPANADMVIGVYPTHHYRYASGYLEEVTYLMKWGW